MVGKNRMRVAEDGAQYATVEEVYVQQQTKKD